MPSIFLVIYALAVARVTRLIVADKITEPWRVKITNWTVQRAAARLYGDDWTKTVDNPADRASLQRTFEKVNPPPKLAYLLTCPWCASIYVGAVAAPLVYWFGSSPWLLVPALALALSHVSGFLATKEG